MRVAAGLARWKKKRGDKLPPLDGKPASPEDRAKKMAEARGKMKILRAQRALDGLHAAAAGGAEGGSAGGSPPKKKAGLKLSLKQAEEERYPGARGSIWGGWHKQHVGHQRHPELKDETKHVYRGGPDHAYLGAASARPPVHQHLGDPDHPYCVLHPHDRYAERRRRAKLRAARAEQAAGRAFHIERAAEERRAARRQYLGEVDEALERLARTPPPTPPRTPEPLLRGSKITELTTGQKLFLSDEAKKIGKRHQFDIYRASLQELQIGLAMWNMLGEEEHDWYEAEAKRRDAQAARQAECEELSFRLFQYYDKDGSGSIDRAEMLKLIEAVAVVEVELTQLALGIDPTEARRIAHAQLDPESIADTFFARMAVMDKDDDEEVSPDELMLYFDGMAVNECQLESPEFEIKVLDPLRELGKRTFDRRTKKAEW